MPLPPARQRATDFKIDSYEPASDQRYPDLDKVEGALSKGHPVVITAALDAEFFDLNPNQSVWYLMPTSRTRAATLTLVGYDDATQTFKFINSWNTGWGDGGYGAHDLRDLRGARLEGHIMKMRGRSRNRARAMRTSRPTSSMRKPPAADRCR